MPSELATERNMPEGHRYSDEQLFIAVQEDLWSRGYQIEKCPKDTTISKDEWEICILNGSIDSFEYDFHFVVRLETSGDWLQKFYGSQLVEIVTSLSDQTYHLVGYYKIKKAEE